jgi:DNA repair ATPase RecN
MEYISEDWEISDLDLPSTVDLVYHDTKGNHAKRREDYEEAREEYNKAGNEAEEILEELETIRDSKELTDQQMEELGNLEDRIDFYDELLERQIERL